MHGRRAQRGGLIECSLLAGSFVVATGSAGCAQPPRAADRGHEAETSRHAASAAACLEAPPETELLVSGSPCPWAGFRSTNEFAWQSLAPDQALAFRSELPEVCQQRTCALEARASPWGPLLVLHVPSPESEMPAGAWLGVPQRGEITFVDLWSGEEENVWSDGTPLGAAFSLAPFDCGGQLALFAVERLPAAAAGVPRRTLREREGLLGGGDTPTERAACVQLSIPL